MDERSPAVRSRHMKNILERVEALPALRRDKLLSLLDARDVRAIRESAPTEWLEIGNNIRTTEAIWHGSEAGERESFFRGVLLADLHSSYLKGLLTSAMQLFGPSPGSFLKWAPRGWPTMFRHCGTMEVKDPTPQSIRVVYTSLPPPIIASSSWTKSACASMTALFEVANVKGEGTVEEQSIAGRRAVLLFRW